MTGLRLFSASMLLLLAATVFLTPAPTSAQTDPSTTETWLLFAEPGFGFEVRYPPHWEVRLVADNTTRYEQVGDHVALRSIGFFGPGSQMFFVDVWQNEAQLSLEDWLAANPPPLHDSLTLSHSRRQSDIAGYTAIEMLSRPSTSGGTAPLYYHARFAADDRVFGLEYAALKADPELYATFRDSFALIPVTQSRTTPSTLSNDLPPASFGVQQATCCGITDIEFNPFPCNDAGADGCPQAPCGNCTWWVRYRRLGGNEANLTRCTGDANTWESCVGSYYPLLLSDQPEQESVVIYRGQNHLSFIERMNSSSSYRVSQLSWDESCPDRSYNESRSSSRRYVFHPDFIPEPNQPPRTPEIIFPDDESWVGQHDITLEWADGGDPDDGPDEPEYYIRIEDIDSDWYARRTWTRATDWDVTLPHDGQFRWRLKAFDGQLESPWSAYATFRADTTPPAAPNLTAAPAANQWYRSEQTFTWASRDAGIGVAETRWAWNNPEPGNRLGGERGSTTLSSASQGQNTLYLQSVDQLGNASAVVAAGWFGYDTRSPQINLGGVPANRWYNRPVSITLTLSDPQPGSGAGYLQWNWRDGTPQTIFGGSTTAELPILQGRYTLEAQAWDAVGNTGTLSTEPWYGYDSLSPTPPQIRVDCVAANNGWQSTCNQPTFTWHSTDPEAPVASGELRYAYAWSLTANWVDATWTDWLTATSFLPPQVGPASQTYLHVAARDQAGNVSRVSTFGFRYDPNRSELPPTETEFVMSLADGALFTASPTVTVEAFGPNVTDVVFSSRLDTAETDWLTLPLSSTTWTLDETLSAGNRQFYYAWFRDADGQIYGPYSDDILFDAVVPRGRIAVAASADSQLILSLPAWDDYSGVAEMRFSTVPTMTNAAWQPYTPTLNWSGSATILYVQYRDRAGNLSPVYGTDGSDSSLIRRLHLPFLNR